MKSNHWTDRLTDYMDGDLAPSEERACEVHLADCRECAGALEELRAVVAQASLLPDLPPSRDLWPEIAARLTSRPEITRPDIAGAEITGAGQAPVVPLASRRRRIVMTVPQLVAAAVALIVLSAGSVWLAGPGAGNVDVAASGTTGAAGGPGTGGATGAAEAAAQGAFGDHGPQVVLAAAYDAAISQLEVEFERRRAELDPETIRVVEQNLAIIDGAIAEAGKALAEDPASAFLNTHLASAMRRKVDLLRRVNAIERTES